MIYFLITWCSGKICNFRYFWFTLYIVRNIGLRNNRSASGSARLFVCYLFMASVEYNLIITHLYTRYNFLWMVHLLLWNYEELFKRHLHILIKTCSFQVHGHSKWENNSIIVLMEQWDSCERSIAEIIAGISFITTDMIIQMQWYAMHMTRIKKERIEYLNYWLEKKRI